MVNSSQQSNSSTIVVPETDYQLNYGSVGSEINFNYQIDGQTLTGTADCQRGLLNGTFPRDESQAHLLNAVCHIRYSGG